MNLKTRRILYISFIIAFFLITPPVLFYAAGYKFNLENGLKMEKTGAFIVDSQPRNADIYINGKLQQAFFKNYLSQEKNNIKTPAKIKNLLPGEYEVRMELEGYLPWVKKLTIPPNTSTYAEDVFLFKKGLPALAEQGKIVDYAMSPDKKKIASLADGKIIISDLNGGAGKKLPAPDGSGKLSWSPDGKMILIGNTAISADSGKMIDLQSYSAETANCAWNENNADEIYCQSPGMIKKIKLPAKIAEEVIGIRADNYLIKSGYAYLVNNANGGAAMSIVKISDKQTVANISLPEGAYEFLNAENELINLYDKNRRVLYLIDPSSLNYSPLRATVDNVNEARWISGGRLLCSNDYEIWIFNPDNGAKTLLTRVSEKIISAVWHPNDNYIIYNTGNSIYAIELDEREKRNVTEIAKMINISKLLINAEGDNLYFSAQAGKQEGLFSLNIN